MSQDSEMLMHISERIREIRTSKRITLKEMSAMTGLSVSFLSQVERGASSLAISSLEKISIALEVPITEFFQEVIHPRYAVYRNEQEKMATDFTSSEFFWLSGEFTDRKLEPLLVILHPNQNDLNMLHQPGEKLYYILEGEVIIRLDGKEYHLRAGDAMHFPEEMPYSLRNPLSNPTRLLFVVTPAINKASAKP